MQKRFQVRLNESDVENLSILYKHHKIPNRNQSDLFRKLLACEVERILHGSQDVKSSRQEEQVGLLEGWDCPCRFTFSRYHRSTKEWHRKVLCSNPTTKRILGTNELDPEVCKRCHDTGGSANLSSLPEPKKQVLEPTPKPMQVKRECIVCHDDISKRPDNHQWCRKCYFEMMNPQAGVRQPSNGLPGSPMWIGKQQAAKLRRLDARLKAAEHQTKEEYMKSAIEHGAELDMQFAEHDHRMKQKQQSKEE